MYMCTLFHTPFTLVSSLRMLGHMGGGGGCVCVCVSEGGGLDVCMKSTLLCGVFMSYIQSDTVVEYGK